MKPVSKERSALMRKWGPIRAQFVMETNCCWVCGRTYNLGVHEIARGIHREAAFTERMTWIVACGECNCGPLHDHRAWPLAKQLALKWVHDRPHFLLEEFNVLRDREPGAITWAEVVVWICRLVDGGLSGD